MKKLCDSSLRKKIKWIKLMIVNIENIFWKYDWIVLLVGKKQFWI